MNNHITIRPETVEDSDQISLLLQEAFKGHPFSHNNEHLIVEALRRSDALALALVAEEQGLVLGHIAFSPVLIDGKDRQWYGLGPVAVTPHLQKQGIGKRLIEAGLESIRKLNAAGCVVLGDPVYYRKFGFTNDPHLVLEGVPAEYFMSIRFNDDLSKGDIHYHSAFTEGGN